MYLERTIYCPHCPHCPHCPRAGGGPGRPRDDPGSAGGTGAVGDRPERENYGFVYTKPYFGTHPRIPRIPLIRSLSQGSDPPFHTRRGPG